MHIVGYPQILRVVYLEAEREAVNACSSEPLLGEVIAQYDVSDLQKVCMMNSIIAIGCFRASRCRGISANAWNICWVFWRPCIQEIAGDGGAPGA